MKENFLGIDIGSSYTKLCLIHENNTILHQDVFPTFEKNRQELKEKIDSIHHQYPINSICATGYGRDRFKNYNFEYPLLNKTELFCASEGVSFLYPYKKTIIDIGGEDIKIITSDISGTIVDFYMNTKCAAGTGSFIVETAEKANIDMTLMSDLARNSSSIRELNSFCTVFAKTEILQWLLEDLSPCEIAKGIYLSIATRITKLRIAETLPVILIGGVVNFHPFMIHILKEKLKQEIFSPFYPQYITAFGAALHAKKHRNI